jgi:hypothetical protein
MASIGIHPKSREASPIKYSLTLASDYSCSFKKETLATHI